MRFASIAEAMLLNSKLIGEKIAIRCEVTKTKLTHKELYERSLQLGTGLQKAGAGRGERIAVLGGNNIRHIEVMAAAAMTGTTVVPINPALEKEEVHSILNEVNPKIIVDTKGDNNQIDSKKWKIITYSDYEKTLFAPTPATQFAPVPEELPWNILYTSGTTSGKPKGVVRSHASAIAGFLTHTGPLLLDDRTVGLVAFPLHGVSSVFFSFLYLYIQGSMVIVDLQGTSGAPENLLNTIGERGVTYLTVSPGIMTGLLRKIQNQKSGLKTVLLTGSASDSSLKNSVTRGFGDGVRVYDVYGSTEAGLITMQSPEDMDTEKDTVGKETPGTHPVRILDDEGEEVADGTPGAVSVRTPMMFTRYLHDPPGTDRGLEYFPQGDVGVRTPSGHLRLLGRVDDLLVLSSGHNIYPIEVETLLHRHVPCLTACYVIGLPTNHHPEVVLAVCAASDPKLTPAVVAEAMREVPAGRKPGKYIVVADDHPLPRTANGKVRKNMLRELFA
eukprot:TRINITY_DN161_c2_g1_i1.p1 TRINITY_DN161_c2_g1~~TRINITY_DN161_c2_g1_i1.p1  ORF type:complete len:507 (+),score=111.17 TRINITY_DN161_c2_g1_i1:24-1523(+)